MEWLTIVRPSISSSAGSMAKMSSGLAIGFRLPTAPRFFDSFLPRMMSPYCFFPFIWRNELPDMESKGVGKAAKCCDFPKLGYTRNREYN